MLAKTLLEADDSAEKFGKAITASADAALKRVKPLTNGVQLKLITPPAIERFGYEDSTDDASATVPVAKKQ